MTDKQAAGYAALRGVPSRSELERFLLDDADRELIDAKRRSHNRLGFAVLMTSAGYLGVFLDDLDEVPVEVVDYLAEHAIWTPPWPGCALMAPGPRLGRGPTVAGRAPPHQHAGQLLLPAARSARRYEAPA
nr:DUF4158 domain-containing protein [Phytoactinopolyspora mesophila]